MLFWKTYPTPIRKINCDWEKIMDLKKSPNSITQNCVTAIIMYVIEEKITEVLERNIGS